MRFRVQLLADVPLRISLSCTPARLAPRRGCLPVHCCYLAKEVGRPSRGSSQIVETSKRCDNIVLTPISPLSSSSNLLRAVPSACSSSHLSVAKYPSLRMCLATKAAAIKFLGVWLGPCPYAGVSRTCCSANLG